MCFAVREDASDGALQVTVDGGNIAAALR